MKLPKDDPNYHAPLSPSGAHRWMECLASVAAEAALPEGPSSEAADEGTRAHDVSERYLNGEDIPRTGDILTDPDTGEQFELGAYVDYCLALGEDCDVIMVETRVKYDEWVPEGSGTADYIGIKLVDQVVEAVDLKYGKGIKVFSKDNPQGMMYLLAVMQELDAVGGFDEYTFTIVQPRLDHVSSWTYTREQILEFGERAKNVAKLIYSDQELDFNPGAKQCQWCAASGMCPAQHDRAMEIAKGEFTRVG